MTWLGNTNGIRFGRHGTILSAGALTTSSSQDTTSCSIEIWLQPGPVDETSTLLAFYEPDNPLQFLLHQDHADLRIQHQEHGTPASQMYLDDALRKGRLVFITITSGNPGTSVYVNGALARTSQRFRLSINDFTGQLVVGTSPVVSDTWSGELRGLGIYNRELTAAQVRHHYETWTSQGRPDVAESERSIGLFFFDEHRGNVIHNQQGPGTDLYIPARYMILREQFLASPWTEFHADWSYWKDIAINIVGFVPLGFFFCGYWSCTRPMRQAAIATIILGAVVTLTIEVGQAYLPTRDSGVTDLITNTLGTYLGVVLYRRYPGLIRWILNRILSVAVRCLPLLRTARPIT